MGNTREGLTTVQTVVYELEPRHLGREQNQMAVERTNSTAPAAAVTRTDATPSVAHLKGPVSDREVSEALAALGPQYAQFANAK